MEEGAAKASGSSPLLFSKGVVMPDVDSSVEWPQDGQWTALEQFDSTFSVENFGLESFTLGFVAFH